MSDASGRPRVRYVAAAHSCGRIRLPASYMLTASHAFATLRPQELGRGDSVKVRMSENPVPTINRTDLTGDWFDSLERCFRWSDRTMQKPLSAEQLLAAEAASAQPAAAGGGANGGSGSSGNGGSGSGGNGAAA